jgi:O-antigen/teichoic acid export membrane protein
VLSSDFISRAIVHRKAVVELIRSTCVVALGPASQLAMIALLSHYLSLNDLGIYLALIVLLPFFADAIGIGSNEVLIRNVARRRDEFPVWFGNHVVCILLTFPAAVAAFVAIMALTSAKDVPILWLVALGGCDMLGTRLLTSAEDIALTLQKRKAGDVLRLAGPMTRLLAVVVVVSSGMTRDPALLAVLIALPVCGIGVAAFVAIGWVSGKPLLAAPREWRLGLHFFLNTMCRTAQGPVDRYALSFVFPAAQFAIFVIAARILQNATIPVLSIVRYNYPTYFAEGVHGAERAIRFGLSMLPYMLVVGMLSTIAAILLAPLLRFILDKDLGSTVGLIQLGAPSLLLNAIYYVGADILSGADRQILRALVNLTAFVVQLVLVVLLAFWLGPYGAIYGLLGSAALAAGLPWLIISRTLAAAPLLSSRRILR